MDKKKTIIITIVIGTVGFLLIASGLADFIRRGSFVEYNYSIDGNYGEADPKDVYSAILIFVGFLALMMVAITIETHYDKAAEEKAKKRSRRAVNSRSDSYGYGYVYNDDNTSEDSSTPNEFIRPWGFIPDPYDPTHRFTDVYGHEYTKIAGTWYDENCNFAPGYLNDYYGLSSYDKRYEDDDDYY